MNPLHDLTDADVQKYIGHSITMPCPNCGGELMEDATGIRWCGKCAWSTDDELSRFITRLLRLKQQWKEVFK